MQDAGIIRNRLKIGGAVQNAQVYLRLVEQTGSFSDWLCLFDEEGDFLSLSRTRASDISCAPTLSTPEWDRPLSRHCSVRSQDCCSG